MDRILHIFIMLLLLTLAMHTGNVLADNPKCMEGQKAFKEMRYEDAISNLEQCLESGNLAQNQKVETYKTLGLSYLAFDIPFQAKKNLEKAIELDPSYDPTSDPVWGAKASALLNKGGDTTRPPAPVPQAPARIEVTVQDGSGVALQGNVYIDGSYMGRAPSSWEIAPGIHELKVETGAGMLIEKIQLNPGQTLQKPMIVERAKSSPTDTSRAGTGMSNIRKKTGFEIDLILEFAPIVWNQVNVGFDGDNIDVSDQITWDNGELFWVSLTAEPGYNSRFFRVYFPLGFDRLERTSAGSNFTNAFNAFTFGIGMGGCWGQDRDRFTFRWHISTAAGTFNFGDPQRENIVTQNTIIGGATGNDFGYRHYFSESKLKPTGFFIGWSIGYKYIYREGIISWEDEYTLYDSNGYPHKENSETNKFMGVQALAITLAISAGWAQE